MLSWQMLSWQVLSRQMPGWNESVWWSLLIGTALKSAAVLGAAWLTAIALGRRSAAARHLVWMAAFAALLALPFLSTSLPAWRVPLGGALVSPTTVFHTTAVPATASPSRDASAPEPLPAGARTLVKSSRWRLDWRLWLILLWAFGAAAVSAPMAAGWAAMWRVRRHARPFTNPQLAGLARDLGIRSAVEVLEAPRGSMPMTFGLVRPAVFLPADAVEWSEERRRMVLLHELAHVKRGDSATHLLARAALSLYWWNPLAWTAWRGFLKERERAADDLVLKAGARASHYAGHLLEIARTMHLRSAGAWAGIAMARPSRLEGRLAAILDSDVNREAPRRAWVLAAAALSALVIAPLAALHAQDSASDALPADVDATIRAALAQKNHEMLEKAARAAEALQKYDLAQRLLEPALNIRAEVSGRQSEDYGLGLLKLGDLERKRNKGDEATAFYAKAVSVLGDRPETANPLLYLGIEAVGRKKEFERAVDFFQRAQLADPTKEGAATMWLAVARQRQKDTEEAESLFKRALEIQDADSADAAVTMELYAKFLREQKREDEARSVQDRAAAARKAQDEQTAASSGPSPNALRVGGEVVAPQVVSKKNPVYPAEAKAAGYEGIVELYVEVDPDGTAHKILVRRGLGLGLDESAVEAVRQWVFKPAMKDGKPVTVGAVITVRFTLI